MRREHRRRRSPTARRARSMRQSSGPRRSEADEEERRRARPEVRDGIDRRLKRRLPGRRQTPSAAQTGSPACSRRCRRGFDARRRRPARRRWRRQAEIPPTETAGSWCGRAAAGGTPRAASGSGASHGVARTSGVVIATAAVASANSTIRVDRLATRLPEPRSRATIDRPITLRMSTLRKLLSAPQPRSWDCSRKRKPSAKISQPAPARRAAAPADDRPRGAPWTPPPSTMARPARNRNSGDARPAMKTQRVVAARVRSAARVHASVTCAQTMTTTATPRSQSRYRSRVPTLTRSDRQGTTSKVVANRCPAAASATPSSTCRARAQSRARRRLAGTSP